MSDDHRHIRLDLDVEVPMRDGTVLRCDIHRPADDERVPALLCRTAYDKSDKWVTPNEELPPHIAARHGYALIVQDIRGRHRSDGDWNGVDYDVEAGDAVDTLRWIAAQRWSTGDVGMFGASYEADNTFAAASVRPAELRAIAPQRLGYPPIGMVPATFLLGWHSIMALDWVTRHDVTPADREIVEQTHRDQLAAFAHRPLADHPFLAIPGIGDIARRGLAGAAEGRYRGTASIYDSAVPALFATGYYDHGARAAVEQYTALRRRGATAAAREGTRLIIGPWRHGRMTAHLGEVFFGPDAAIERAGVVEAHLAFFDEHLRGRRAARTPRVRYFVMGANRWRSADEWPPPGTAIRPLYLRSDGRADFTAPPGPEPADHYVHDPADPVPSFGGRYSWGGSEAAFGPFDQRRVEQRPDVLTYTGEPRTEPLEIAGDIALRLWVTSTAPDTDFMVKLCDVDQDGISRNLTDGVMRARWRNGPGSPAVPLTPGEPVELPVELGPVAHSFLPGHRIRVQIASSSVPWYDVNMNTGGAPGTEATGPAATQHVLHDVAHPSCVLLPVTS
ncbi:MAG TPA: CocE/NonD family hydrolase [Pseudonocardiaceae bacterium]|nr:CocE/NonD family hydrolase [Pseudonocardiaceae bacterium]